MNASLNRWIQAAAILSAACAQANADDIMTIDSVQVHVWANAFTQARPALPPVEISAAGFPTAPIAVSQVASGWNQDQGTWWPAYARADSWLMGRSYPRQNAFGGEMHAVTSYVGSAHHLAEAWAFGTIQVDFTISQPTRARMYLAYVDPGHGGGSPNNSLYQYSTGAFLHYTWTGQTGEVDLTPGAYRFHYNDRSETYDPRVPEAFYGTSVFHFEVPSAGSSALFATAILALGAFRRR